MVGIRRSFSGCTVVNILFQFSILYAKPLPRISLLFTDPGSVVLLPYPCESVAIRSHVFRTGEWPWPLNGGYFSQFGQHFWGHASIHVDHGYRFPRRARLPVAYPAAKGEIRDIDLVFAQNRAHLPDYAGDVTVAHVDEITLERSFHINPIHMKKPGRVFVQDRAFYQMFFAGSLEQNREYAAGAAA